ncbi:MAG TPA: ABC transporter ATP-binding protein [Aggregatilineales bacterium]|nr:ABC transporter ATP-binding protein [Aggregatilineales bacterium]
MSSIELQNITKTFGDTIALDDVSLAINDGEFFVLLGPTGAGKTTTLRVIAGLEKQNQGTVLFDNESVNTKVPADRDVAFVFQQYSLYPNMTVYENLAFPLKSPLRNIARADIDRRVREAATKLHITHLLDRKTAKLSGGEMQRVSIGRAIVRQPRVYLMDEPLSNLDAKLREALRVEIEHLQKTQHSTTLFVTHDQIEALTMADRIAVLDEGKILQIGTPYDIYDRPATTFVAQLVGTPRINLVDATRQNGSLYVKDSLLQLGLPENSSIPSDFLLGIRPEDIRLSSEGSFQGKVILTEPLGVETIIHIRSGEQTFLSLVPGVAVYKVDDDVQFDVEHDRLHFFNLDGKRVSV